MSSRQQRIQTLYEISLAIEPRETLENTADRALSAYLQKLNCSVGAVFRVVGTADGIGLSLTASIPSSAGRTDLFQRASSRLENLARTSEPQSVCFDDGSGDHRERAGGGVETARETRGRNLFEEQLPVAERVDGSGEYHLMELPGFGAILLGKRGGTVDPGTVSSLSPLNEKLAQACRSNLTERKLREQRDRFEAMFDAIPESVVNVVVEDGTERIVRANEVFKETFVADETPVFGQDLNELVVPDEQSVNTEALTGALDRGEPLESELRRETASGSGHFLFSGVPVTASEENEYFGVYVDITEQKERERTLEELYDAAQGLLSKKSQQQVCSQAVQTIESVLEYPAVGIHLYQRESEALEPIAVSERIRKKLDGEPAGYTDKKTIVWQAYDERESVRIDDTREFDGTLPDEETPTRSAVILPIGVHGVLITSAFEPDVFDDQDVYFLRLLSRLVAIALDRAASEAGLTAVQRTMRDALHADTHEEMAARVLEEIPQTLDLPIAGIWKHRPANQQLEPVDHTAQAAELVGEQPTFSEGSSIAWQTFAERTTSVVPDVSKLNDAHNPETPVKGEITVPVGDFGVLTAASTQKNSFTELDAEILETLATNLEAIAEVIDSRQDIDLLDQVIARILRHNVRNELNSISGYADIITEEAEEPISEYAQRIVDDCGTLERTAAHAREMREVVRNRDKISTVSLGTTVRTAAESVNEEFPDYELAVHIAKTPEVTAHPELGTAIRHLIRNGFEHNDSDAPCVEVVVERRPNGPTVEITDNGPGIDTYELEILDEHGESALEHGSGVGLWIVDRIIEYSEALLEFEATAQGTTAAITFPPSADTTADE
jgi:PAS domain S-box-containing protein